jgi:hypothetical protein
LAGQVMAMPERPELCDGERSLAKSTQHTGDAARIENVRCQLPWTNASWPQQQQDGLAKTYLCHIGLAQTRMCRDIHAATPSGRSARRMRTALPGCGQDQLSPGENPSSGSF